MAIKVDASRPVSANVLCARSAFTQPTPRTMNRFYSRKLDAAETHIPSLAVAVAPVNNTADNQLVSHPIVQFTGFWLDKVVKTVRP